MPGYIAIYYFVSILSYRRICKLNALRLLQPTGVGEFSFQVKLEFVVDKHMDKEL